MSTLLCPQCRNAMTRGRLGPLELDLCLPCQGVWFDSAEFRQLVSQRPAAMNKLAHHLQRRGAPPQAATLSGTCPICSIPLAAPELPFLPGQRVPSCVGCRGIWISGRQLGVVGGRLQHAPQARAAPAPAPQPGPQPEGFFDAPESDLYTTRGLASPSFSPGPIGGAAPQGGSFGPPAAAGLLPADALTERTVPVYPPPAVTPEAPPGTAIPQWGPGPAPAVPPPDPNVLREGEFLCRNCREKNRVGDLLCWACGAPFRGAQQGQCPRCDGPLHTLQVEECRLFACENCGGVEHEPQKLGVLMLQPVDVQDELLGRVARNHTGTPQHRHAVPVCSACGPALYSAPMMVSPTPVLTCPLCHKTFLDGGDLEELLLAQRLTRR